MPYIEGTPETPYNAAAWLSEAKQYPVEVKEAPYPTPAANEVVIANESIAVNPLEAKVQEKDMWKMTYPSILGSDVAGYIVECGNQVRNFQVGQRVLGHPNSYSTWDPRHGGFQKYCAVPASVVTAIPGNMSFEQACVLPTGVFAAAAALFFDHYLALPRPSVNPKPSGKTLLIWGGGSSLGSCAIQLARAAGLEVITGALEKDFETCKAVGASQIFDSRSPTVSDDIRDALKGTDFVGAFDAVTVNTVETSAKVVGNVASGRKVLVTTVPTPQLEPPTGVEIKTLTAGSLVNDELAPYIFHHYLPQALRLGQFIPKPDPVLIGTGLSMVQEGMDKSKSGVSKVVINI